jgi:hypothetical protein
LRTNRAGSLIAGTLTVFFALLLAACGGGGGGSTSSTPPTASAGAGQTVFKKATVTLDGSASSDAAGDSLTYSWSQTSGPAVTLSSPSSVKPTFTAPSTTSTLVFSLVVSDGHGNSSAPASVTISVQDRAPTAMAGSNTSVAPLTTYTLDGTGSSDPDGDTITYAWTQTAGTPVTLNTPVTGKATFTVPVQPGVLQFSLVVTDGELSSQPSMVMITVTTDPVPVAIAGADQTAPKRSLAVLQGSGTDSDQQTLTYLWQQVAGTPVTIQNATSATASFIAPATSGDLKFSLTVNDGINNSQPSTLTVHVIDLAPVVYSVALSPGSPRKNDPISATVSAADPDGDSITLSYVWSRNGTVVAGATGAAYPLGNQAKNDTISVVVTASDGTLTATGGSSVVIADTPATLASNAPTSAVFGAAGSFQVTATDVDGDPTGAIELAYGPPGMTVSGSGQVSWTPSGPLFDRTVNMNWGVRLHDTPTVTLSGTITVTDPNRNYPLLRTDAGLATSSSSLDVEDFAGDGHREMLIASQQSVFLLQKNGTDYDQIWAYPFDTASGAWIAAVASGDVNGDGHREIFFSAGPVVVELDGVTRREIARYGTTATGTSGSNPNPSCTSLKVADIDNDGRLELVCLGIDFNANYPAATGRVYVLDAQTLQLKWMTDDLVLGGSMAVGNVDSDPALEIVTSGGYVFDGATGANQWAYAPGFGAQVDIGDVIGDGVGKIVGTGAFAGVTAYDAVQKSVLWTIPAGISGFSAIKVAELDGTAPAEVIAADGQWGNVTVFRYTAGAPQVLTSINSIGDGVTAIATGDVNGDGLQEIVWTPTFSLTNGSPTVAISSWTPTATLLWTGPLPLELDGPFVCAKQAQVAAGQSLLMFMAPQTEEGYSGMRVVGLNPTTGFFTVSQQVDTNWAQVRACDVADVHGNGVDSVLLGTAALYNPYFTAFDFLSSTKQWSSPQLSGSPAAVTHADVNGDGVPDLIGITTDGHLYAWDVRGQTLIWSLSGIGTGVDVAVGDVYGDGKQEIIALTSTQVLVFTQSSAGLTQKASYAVAGSDLLVADTNGDGKAEIYVLANASFGSSNASVYQLDGSLTLLNSYPIAPAGSAYASSLYLEESAFPRKNIVVALGAESIEYTVSPVLEVLDPSSGAQVWQSPPLRGYIPPNSLNYYDLTGSGQKQMVFGTSVGMYVTQ